MSNALAPVSGSVGLFRGHLTCKAHVASPLLAAGLHLRRLNISPNHNLRTAIERWSLHSDMHLTFKPVLATLVAQRQCQQVQALTSTPCHDALQNAAASLEPGLQEPVQSRGVRPG